jgi:subtilisin family serine protease
MAPDESRENGDSVKAFDPSDDKRWWDPYDEDLKNERSEVQIRRILDAFEGAGVPVSTHRDADTLPDYLYGTNRIITRDEDAARVYRALGRDRAFDKRRRDQSSAPAGLHVITLEDGQDSSEVLDELDERLGEGVAAHDHVVHVSTWCSSTEALPTPGAEYHIINDDPESDGRRSRVSVVDTGVLQGVVGDHPQLAGVAGMDEPASVGHYTGHGTFVAGVVRQYAPAAEVRIEAGFDTGGASLESDLVAQLERALDWVPDVINFSGGTRTRGGLPLLAFQVFYEQRLRHLAGTIFVAAAGNDGDRGPFWPATFPWAVSVGALALPPDVLAGFSNRGSWVDVYAPGTDIESTYPKERYDYREPPLIGRYAEFPNGVARWSGTSFAAPMVSGLIAARMTWSGESAIGASESLLEIARQNAIVGVGAVLRSTDDGRRQGQMET